MSTETTDDAITAEVRTFLHDWFRAIQANDRPWVEAHLAPEFSDWLIPTGKATPRKHFIDLQMGMTEFIPELIDLRVQETGGFVSALMELGVREVYPEGDELTDELREAMEIGDVSQLVDGELLDPDSEDPVIIHSTLRRTPDGLRSVHHMLVGKTQTTR